MLTLASPVIYGDAVTVAYTKPSSNPLQTPAGGQAASISAQNVINNLVFKNKRPKVILKYDSKCYSGFVNAIDATESYDEDNDRLTFEWEVSSTIPVSSKNGSMIEFLAPIVNEPEEISFTVFVSDGKTTESESFSIEVLPYKPELELAEVETADASSFVIPDYPNNVFDGDNNTSWSASGLEAWMILELKRPFCAMHFTLSFKPGLNGKSHFNIYGSNNKIIWEPILLKMEPCSFSYEAQVFEASPSKGDKGYKYIKLVRSGENANTYSSVSEIRIFGYNDTDSLSFEKGSIIIFPNPAHQFINIRIDDPLFAAESINIYDLSRKLVSKFQADPDQMVYQIPINLRSGTYLVVITGKGKIRLTKKIIVIN